MPQFRVLGPLQALGDPAAHALGGPKQRVLLAYLLLRRGRLVPREELIDAIWGDAPPASAVSSLQVYVHGLRRVLGPNRIKTRGIAYRIHLEAGELDLDRFEEQVALGRRSLAEGMPERAASALRDGLALWRGPPLGDLPADSLVAERAHLEELRLSAMELLAEADLARGRHEELLAELAILIAEHPFRERLRQHQILALYRSGRQNDALQAYREAHRVLADELGIEPGPGLRELEAAILRQDPQLAPAAVTRSPKIVLPAAPTRLIGRERELTEVVASYREDGARLVTLTGPGGTGKTRLALAVAEHMAAQLVDGARFVDLAAVSEPELVLPTIAEALDIEGGGRPAADAVAEYLRSLNILLVLDNLEQLLPAARLIGDLLTLAPALLILATSRIHLNLRAEHVYPVPPLQLPEPDAAFDAVARCDAVRLLAERARAVNRERTLTSATAATFTRICRRLDGLPLAIELAAARMRALSPDEVAAGLERALEVLVEGPTDLPDRQRTLRATLDWSHELLGEPERRLFACLAAFAGGFRREDVEAIAATGPEPLAGLVEASLVAQIGAERFSMLETIREYAGELLESGGENALVRRRHSRRFLALAEQAHEAILSGDAAPAAYRRLEEEHDNLRAALAWAQRSGDVESEVRLACALRQFWLVRGHLDEGRTFFERAVAATVGGDPSLRALALMHGGPFLYRQGRLAEARAWWEEALVLLSEAGDRAGAARCAGELGAVAFSEGDLDQAVDLFERSAKGFAELGDELRVAIVNSNLAEVEGMRGDLRRAVAHGEKAVSIFRTLDDPDALAIALSTLARLHQASSGVTSARGLFAESLACARKIGYREVIAGCVQAAARMALDEGQAERAARLASVARAALARMGVRLQGLEGHAFSRTEEALARRLGRERLRAIAEDVAEVPLEAVIDEASALLGVQTAPAPH